jgi:hypothetical protein
MSPIAPQIIGRVMTIYSSWLARLASRVVAVGSLALLTGCIGSADPIFTDPQPLLGQKIHFQFYELRAGGAHKSAEETYRWQGARYVRTRGSKTDVREFTLHAFEGGDLIAQSVKSKKLTEYAILHKIAEDAYLLTAIDEGDADQATRDKFCDMSQLSGCVVTTQEAVLAFARATAARQHDKPYDMSGLVLILAD